MARTESLPPPPPTGAPSRPSGTRTPVLVWLAVAAIVTNVAIVVTGGVVRVTGSGLGCPDWPTCNGGQVLPAPGAEAGWHQAVEFGNRLMTFLVLAVAIAVWVAVRRATRRRELRRLALGLPLGVIAQAVLGGITVLTGLNPLIVAAHFLLSMAIIAVAVVLHDRIDARSAVITTDHLRSLTAVLVGLAAVVLVLGTLVTAAGPHAGDAGTPRLGLDIASIARWHAAAVWGTVALTVAGLVYARSGNPRLRRAFVVLLVAELVQGAIGYTQYVLGIPAWLVALHLLGACLFWVAALRVVVAARPVPGAPVPTREAAAATVAARA